LKKPTTEKKVHLLRLDQIVVSPNRQRREFDKKKLIELAASITRSGLIHPIVVESVDNPTLRVGERRLRAVREFVNAPYRHDGEVVQPTHIPVTFTGDLTPIEREEVELEENIIRVDLTWKERNDVIAKLHTLRTRQLAERGEKQLYTLTAREIKGNDAVTSNDILEVRNATILQPFLDDPEVAKAATEREALSIVRRKLTQTFNAKLAQNFDVKKSSSPHTLHHGSCEVVFPQLPDSVFDIICVDPPYGINAHKMSTMSQSETGMVHEYEDTAETAAQVWQTIFSEGARVCKPAAHLYMFCDFRHWHTLVNLAEDSGWDVWSTPIIWHKPSGGLLGDSTRGPRKSYETILYATRGDKRVTGVYLDVIVENPADSALHAAAKPVAVITNLLRRSCVPGDRVLDPCAGSGTIFPAANKLRCIATGIELSPVHYATALQRLGE